MRVDVRIRTYELKSNGELEPLNDYPFDTYGACPNVGDTICVELADGRIAFSVTRRYYLDIDGFGWALVVRRLDESDQITRVMDAWEEDIRFWGEIEREEEKKEEEERRVRIAELVARPAKPTAKRQAKTAPRRRRKRTRAPEPKG